ncbi:hypothetical protein, partial [Bifidobacterium animalis]
TPHTPKPQQTQHHHRRVENPTPKTRITHSRGWAKHASVTITSIAPGTTYNTFHFRLHHIRP